MRPSKPRTAAAASAGLARRRLALALAVALSAGAAAADVVPSPREWTVKPDFGKSGSSARKEISGVACVPGTGRCIIANDEKKYAQFFELDEAAARLRPGDIVRLLPDKVDGKTMKELDAEAAAYAAPCLYVTGSHGRGRKGSLRDSTFYVACVPVDPSNGAPNYPFEADEPSEHVLLTGRLRQTIGDHPDLAAFAEQELEPAGVSIEGLAAHAGNLWFGLRSPVVDAHALVLRVAIDDMFGATPPPGTVERLALGENVGIRDLAGVEDGILVLAARSDEPDDGPGRDDDAPTPAIWFWPGAGGEPVPLGELPGLTPADKAEALLVLSDEAGTYRVLVFFDGVENGGPREFIVVR